MPPNVFGDDWDAEQTQPGFTWKRLRLGQRLGAERLGASVFELPPGQRSFPYHLHHANEELLIVLEGSVSVRGKDSERTLERGESALFPVGRDGAHQVVNRSERPARIVVLSTMVEPDITEFPDTRQGRPLRRRASRRQRPEDAQSVPAPRRRGRLLRG